MQAEFLRVYHNAFDAARSSFLVGELVWNFADFATAEGITRVGGRNLKGAFTRQRAPKAAAHLLRRRYLALAREIGGTSWRVQGWPQDPGY
jgi:beta-glucuronidase